ncbi:DUF4150 domain-containing protein [Burkholderia sp. Z1]|uniref:DUF4150 domain-containing protein n=1 Tax=Burkholderia sp. Z1 TaxID=2759039 RepID=UPI00186791B6|nr:DUF4150 domain-containing protein [Burkholderia sp. Z1]
MFANCSAGGMAQSGTDVCKTPPLAIPIPYLNIALLFCAVPNILNILICGGPAHNLCTIISFTLGDEPGAMGGVGSGTVSGPSCNIEGSGKVMLHGAPQTRMTDCTMPNNHNTVGVGVCPSQTIVLILC